MPGAPTGVAVLDGGARVVVGYEGRFAIAGGFALFRRSAAGYVLVNSVRTESAVEGVAVGPDGRTAVATTRYGLAAVDLAALEAGTAKARSLRIGAAPGITLALTVHCPRLLSTPAGSATTYQTMQNILLEDLVVEREMRAQGFR